MHELPDPAAGDVTTLTFPTAVQLCTQIDSPPPASNCHAAVLANDSNEVTLRVALQGLFTIEHAAGWALGFNSAVSAPSVLLMSVIDHDPIDVDALELWDFDRMRRMLGHFGVELRDWLLSDGWTIRSMAYTVDPQTAWLSDALAVRTEQLHQTDPGLVVVDDCDCT
jgi:hypothetical protein